MTRPTWQDDAACTGKGDMFTVEANDSVSRADVVQIREAAAHICAGCPVRNQCGAQAEAERLAPAVRDEILVRPFGIWGGLFYDGSIRPPQDPIRHARIRQLNAAGQPDTVIAQDVGLTVDQVRAFRIKSGLASTATRRPPILGEFEHGLPGDGGRRKHLRRGEVPCDACLEASRVYSRRKQAESNQRRRDRQDAA